MKKIVFIVLLFIFNFSFVYAQTNINTSQEVINFLKKQITESSEDSEDLEQNLSDLNQLQDIYNTPINSGYVERVSVSATPSHPKANETVVMEIKHYSKDYVEALYTWSVNGEVRLKERGARQFSFQVGKNGEEVVVRVVIDKSSGSLTRTYRFTPADVDLIYESNGYVHPFYRGSAYFTKEGFVKVVAYPELYDSSKNKIPAEELSYNWYLNGDLISKQSGYGKNVFRWQASLLSSPGTIMVEVTSSKSSSVAEGFLSLPFQNPLLLVYEKSPLYGTIFERAIVGDFQMQDQEVEFEAVPYFFNKTDTYLGRNKYTWEMNGVEINVPFTQNYMNFRNENNEEGTAQVSLGLKNSTTFQKDSFEFNINF